MLGIKMNSSGKQAPISSHPAFPAVVALWFAALLGLGSLVLPVILFEKLVTFTGLSALFASAEPPLGTTARILIALVAAGAGAIAGVLIARKVAAIQAGMPPHERSGFSRREVAETPETPAKKPISAHEELGAQGLDEPLPDHQPERPTYAGRRRALSVTDDSGPSEYLEAAPLPGADVSSGGASYDFAEEEPGTLDLGEVALAQSEYDPVDTDQTDIFGQEAADMPETEVDFSSDLSTPTDDLQQELAAMNDLSDTPEQARYNPLSSEVGPVEMPVEMPVDMVAKPFARTDEDAPVEAAVGVTATDATNASVAAKPLDELGMVELVERFAIALQSKAAKSGSNAAEAPAETPAEVSPLVFRRSNPVAAEAFDDAEQRAESEAAEPVPFEAVSMTAPAVPTALRPLGFDEDHESDEEGDLQSLSLSFPRSAAASAVPGYDTDQTGGDDTSYSSLLDMKSPFAPGQEFVRIEDEDDEAGAMVEPVVVFPSDEQRRAPPAADGPARDLASAPATMSGSILRPFDGPAQDQPASPSHSDGGKPGQSDAGETERALREALEKLQRMSGAA